MALIDIVFNYPTWVMEETRGNIGVLKDIVVAGQDKGVDGGFVHLMGRGNIGVLKDIVTSNTTQRLIQERPGFTPSTGTGTGTYSFGG